MTKPLVNKVAQKAIVTINAADYIPKEILMVDLKEFLFQELILKEKEFRTALKSFDFSIYRNKATYITCSNDAIVPMWAFMLTAAHLNEYTDRIIFAKTEQEAQTKFVLEAVKQLETKPFENQRIVVKGCGDKAIDTNVYIALTQKLQPIAKAINFGEACSMVPVYKKTN